MRKLNKQKAKIIRSKYAEGWAVADIAKEFHCSKSTIYDVLRNNIYHDQNYEPPRSYSEALEDFDPFYVNELRTDGWSWSKIARKIHKFTGVFVPPPAVRKFFLNQFDATQVMR